MLCSSVVKEGYIANPHGGSPQAALSLVTM